MPMALVDSKSFTKAIKAVSRFTNPARERSAYIHLVFSDGLMHAYACDGYRAAEGVAFCTEDSDAFTAYIDIPRVLPKKECLVKVVLEDGFCTVSFEGVSMRTRQPSASDWLDIRKAMDDYYAKVSTGFALNVDYALDALKALKQSGAATGRKPVIVEFSDNPLAPVFFRGEDGGRTMVLPVRMREEYKHYAET